MNFNISVQTDNINGIIEIIYILITCLSSSKNL